MRRDILYMLIKEYLRGQGGEQFKDWLTQVRHLGQCSEALLEGALLELSKCFHSGGSLDSFTASLLVEYFIKDNISLVGFLFTEKLYSPVESMREMRSILDALRLLAGPIGTNGPVCPVAQARIFLLTPALSA